MLDSQAFSAHRFGVIPPSVLVVEDHRPQLVHLLDQFRAIGITPRTAATAHEAIRVAATERPDVVFVDGLLPLMHGFDVARFIKKLDASYCPFVVLMTSIYKAIRYRNEAQLKCGVDRYVEKPLTTELLLDVLESAVLTRHEVVQ